MQQCKVEQAYNAVATQNRGEGNTCPLPVLQCVEMSHSCTLYKGYSSRIMYKGLVFEQLTFLCVGFSNPSLEYMVDIRMYGSVPLVYGHTAILHTFIFHCSLNCDQKAYHFYDCVFVQAMAGFFTYFVIMGQNGFLPQDLFFLRRLWDKHSTLLGDSYGQEWVSLIFDVNMHVTFKGPLKLHNSHDQQEWGGAQAPNRECLGMVSSTYQQKSLVGINLISSEPQVLHSWLPL